MEWFTKTYINTICSGSGAPQEIQDADKLYPCLYERACNYNNRYIVRNDVQKNSPRPIRYDANRVEAALRVLQQRGQIAIWHCELIVIDMSPQLQPDQASLANAIMLYRSKRRSKNNCYLL